MKLTEHQQKKIAPLLIICVGASILSWAWDYSPDPVIDFGREVYVPWRLAQGELLYRDINYFNGPLSPYFNAAVFKGFGESLRTLKATNTLIIALIAMLIYRLALAMSDRVAATAAAIAFLVIFAAFQFVFAGNYNFLTPYSHELTHGTLLALLGLFALNRFVASRASIDASLAGQCLGLILLTKAEVFLAASIAIVGGFVLTLCLTRPRRMPSTLAFLAGYLIPPLLALILLTSAGLTAHDALLGMAGSWRWLGDRSLLGLPFFRDLTGTSDLAGSMSRLLLVTICWLCVFGGPVVIAIFMRRTRDLRSLITAGSIIAAPMFALLTWQVKGDAWLDAVRPIPLLAAIVVAILAAMIWRRRRRSETDTAAGLVLPLSFAIFAGALTAKIILNVRTAHYGFALAMPGTMLLVIAVVGWLPAWVKSRGGSELIPRLAGIAVLAAALLAYLRLSHDWFSHKRAPVAAGTDDSFLADHRGPSVDALAKHLRQFTSPGTTLVCMPEGLLTNFLARRRNPTSHLNFTPPALIMFGEDRMLADFRAHPPDYIAIFNHPTPEYGAAFFGKDYAVELGKWIRENYEPEMVFDASLSRPEKFGITLLRRLDRSVPAPR